MRQSLERLVAGDNFWATRVIRWGAILLTLGGFWMVVPQIYRAGHNLSVSASIMGWGVGFIAFGLAIIQKADVSGSIRDVAAGIAVIRGRRKDDSSATAVVTTPSVVIGDEAPPDPAAEAKAQDEANQRG